MNRALMRSDPFFDLLCQLTSAHGQPSPESPADVRELAFTPGGASYRLIPQPQDQTQALLEIDITRLDRWLDKPSSAPALERLLCTLLQLNAHFEDEPGWLISLNDEDLLVLSTCVHLLATSAEAVQVLALQGLQRAHALRNLCEELS